METREAGSVALTVTEIARGNMLGVSHVYSPLFSFLNLFLCCRRAIVCQTVVINMGQAYYLLCLGLKFYKQIGSTGGQIIWYNRISEQ